MSAFLFVCSMSTQHFGEYISFGPMMILGQKESEYMSVHRKVTKSAYYLSKNQMY